MVMEILSSDCLSITVTLGDGVDTTWAGVDTTWAGGDTTWAGGDILLTVHGLGLYVVLEVEALGGRSILVAVTPAG